MTSLRLSMRSIAAGMLLLLGLGPCSIAQTTGPSNAAALAMRDNEIRIVNAILSAFSRVMDSNELAILREIEVRIPMDYDLTRVIAYRKGGRLIDVSFGFYGMLIQQCDDWVLADYYSAFDATIYDRYEAYLRYLNTVIDKNERAVGKKPESPQPFAKYAGIPSDVAAQIMNRHDAQDYVAGLRVAAIAFVLAHEIGHHVLGHIDSPRAAAAESRRRETEADRYAAALTWKVGMPAFGALPALAFFGAAEGDSLDRDATHPLAYCRILGAMMYTVDRLAKDRNAAPLFEKAPDMRPGGKKYNAFMATMKQNCT